MPCLPSYLYNNICHTAESDLIKSVPWCVTISYAANFLMKIMRLRSDCVRRVNVRHSGKIANLSRPDSFMYPKCPKNVYTHLTQYKWTTPVSTYRYSILSYAHNGDGVGTKWVTWVALRTRYTYPNNLCANVWILLLYIARILQCDMYLRLG